MLKRFLKSDFAARLSSLLIGLYLRLVYATSKETVIGQEHFDEAAAKGKGVILAFWHSRLMTAPIVRKRTDRRVFMLISANRDGEIIARAVEPFGIDFIRGSAANPKKPEKNKRGASAIAQMTAVLEEGNVVGLTPDGPRGPREKAQLGVIRLAQMTGAPIIPSSASMSRGWRLNTWDRFMLGAPFTKSIHIGGQPIYVGPENDPDAIENARKTLENALTLLTHEADELAGRDDRLDDGE